MPPIELPDSFHEFVRLNIHQNPSELRLKYHGKKIDFDIYFAITQIECRRRFQKKLENFLKSPRFLFPTPLSGEQASHQAVALYHASLFTQGENVLDMTAGLGIDALSISRKVKKITACELDANKAKCLIHNSNILSCDNLEVENADSVKYISATERRFDTVFIDPARRGNFDARLYNLRDCQPDVLTLIPIILKKSKRLLIKASPMLDVMQTLNDIPQTTSVRCISVDGECKEVLIEVEDRDNDATRCFEAVNLDKNGALIYSLRYNSKEWHDSIEYASESDLKPSQYLYEPDASVMKLSPWSILASRFPRLRKLGKTTHLYVSSDFYPDFPGRKLRIKEFIDKKSRKSLKGLPANVVVRNYPQSAEELRKKLSVKEGKDTFIYGTRVENNPVLILAERITS